MSANKHAHQEPPLKGLTQKDKIQILLNEYSTLRAEIISRTASGFTLTTIGVAILTWIIKEFSVSTPWFSWIGVATLLTVFGVGVFVNLRDITRAGRRVKALEHEINSRAGEHLLTWETLSGVATRKGGIIASFFSGVKPLPESDRPPLQNICSDESTLLYNSDVDGRSDLSKNDPFGNNQNVAQKSELLHSSTFWKVLATGLGLVVLQGVFAYEDGYLSQTQVINAHGIKNAYAFIEHGGMWADLFIATPIAAYIVTRYRLPYRSRPGFVALAFALSINISAVIMYQEISKTSPEAHAHFGNTTLAGWTHGLYAVGAMWIFSMYYLTHAIPRQGNDMILASLGLTALLVLGVMKFNPNWSWSTEAIIQVAVSVFLLWLTTAFRFGRITERRSHSQNMAHRGAAA